MEKYLTRITLLLVALTAIMMTAVMIPGADARAPSQNPYANYNRAEMIYSQYDAATRWNRQWFRNRLWRQHPAMIQQEQESQRAGE